MQKPPKPRNDRLDAERMFTAVVDAGSFAEAARRLGTSSGQASKLVSKLEADLGVQLLKRTTRALWPTEAGKRYHQGLKPLIEDFDRLESVARNASGRPIGRLRLSVPMSFGKLQLTKPLLAFAEIYPEILLDIDYSDRQAHLVDEGFDLALRIGKPADSSLVARRLCECRMVTVAAPAYLASHGTPQSPQELRDHDCLIDTNHRDPLQWSYATPETLAPIQVPLRPRAIFSNGEACLAAAEAGLGIARLPTFIAGGSLRAGHVTPILAVAEGPPLAIFMLYPPARDLALKVRRLIDHLAEHFRGTPDWDKGWS